MYLGVYDCTLPQWEDEMSSVKSLLKEIAGLAQDDSDDICELGWSLSEILEKALIAIKEIEDE